jgi:HipA-like protein
VTDAEWSAALQAGVAKRPKTVVAKTFLRQLDGFSKGVLLSCDDGADYSVKGPQIGRAIVNEHIVARLGILLGAPVPEAEFVCIEDLRAIEPKLAHMGQGLCHGSLWAPDCSNRENVQYTTEPENRPRFALLALLYSWAHAGDHQFIYKTQPPHLVYSLDHGHFFPGGPNWEAANLAIPPVTAIDGVFGSCQLLDAELRIARASLEQIKATNIADAVAGPPDDWGINIDERLLLVKYLDKRRGEVLNFLPS